MLGAAKSRCNEVPCWAEKLLVTEIAGSVREKSAIFSRKSRAESPEQCDDVDDDADPPYIANNGLWPRFVEISNIECHGFTLDSFSITRTDPSGEVC